MSRELTRQQRNSRSSSRSQSPSAQPARMTETSNNDVTTTKIFPTPSQPADAPSYPPIQSTFNTAGLARDPPIEPEGDTLSLATQTPLPSSPKLTPRKLKKQTRQQRASTNTNTHIPATMPPPSLHPIPLLICSIGNPGAQYANTLHSAGHTVLAALATYISAPPFQKDRLFANGLVSQASYSSSQPQWTLFQSPAYMNESGKPVAKAYVTWKRGLEPGVVGKVVVVHDELERPLGSVSVREGVGLSARGHNGIKSLLAHMGKTGFVRVGVGIGRPVGRGPDEVAGFVLKKMSPAERGRIEGAVSEVYEKLRGVGG